MANTKRVFISLGGAGNNILDSIQKETKLIDDTDDAVYINFAKTDISDKSKGHKLVLDAGGTGRDPNVGKKIAQENLPKIENFLKGVLKTGKYNEIILMASLGGGTGSSLTPYVIDVLRNQDIPISVFSVLPSTKEGVSTMPNAIKAFMNIYNNYVLYDKLNSFFLFDNEFYEKFGNYDSFDFKNINIEIAKTIEEILDESKVARNSQGYQSLDINERKRVYFWGKGISDYCKIPLKKDTKVEDVRYASYIYSDKYKTGTAKSVAAQVLFRVGVNTAENNGLVEKANEVLSMLKKNFKNSAFYFGYTFDNNELESDIEIRLIVNGLEVPKSFTSDAKKASKSVGKLKEENSDFSVSEDIDLNF